MSPHRAAHPWQRGPCPVGCPLVPSPRDTAPSCCQPLLPPGCVRFLGPAGSSGPSRTAGQGPEKGVEPSRERSNFPAAFQGPPGPIIKNEAQVNTLRALLEAGAQQRLLCLRRPGAVTERSPEASGTETGPLPIPTPRWGLRSPLVPLKHPKSSWPPGSSVPGELPGRLGRSFASGIVQPELGRKQAAAPGRAPLVCLAPPALTTHPF